MGADVFANDTNKANMFKTKEGDTQSGYAQEKLLGSAYLNITEVDGSSGKALRFEVDGTALAAGVSTNKIKMSSNDTTPDYGATKFIAGTGISMVVSPDGGNEKMTIAGAYTAGAGITITGASIASTALASESTFSGSATKVPTSKAVADTLRALTITDAADVGASGNSIMWKTISLPVANSCVCEGGQPDFTDHYPSSFPNIDLTSNQGMTFAERGLGLKLITTESATSSAEDGYGAALLEAMIDEDCSDNNTIFLDAIVYTQATGFDTQTNLRCIAIGYREGQTPQSSPVSDLKILDATGSGLIKKASFEIDLGAILDTKPFAIKFFLFSGSALITPDTGYACVDRFTLMSARVRYPIKTINLRDADVDI